MSFAWTLRTARLVMTPVGGRDLGDLQRLKADPRVFAVMLGGVRSAQQTAEELADDVMFWGRHGYGIWAVREGEAFMGITGLKPRPDGRGVALRFALWPEAQGRGLAREAAGAALRYGHETARLTRVIAVARETNFASRTVLGSIGMYESARFTQAGFAMLEYESLRLPDLAQLVPQRVQQGGDVESVLREEG
jgi:RimJ/RimL family protein N-acetyltransferase